MLLAPTARATGLVGHMGHSPARVGNSGPLPFVGSGAVVPVGVGAHVPRTRVQVRASPHLRVREWLFARDHRHSLREPHVPPLEEEWRECHDSGEGNEAEHHRHVGDGPRRPRFRPSHREGGKDSGR
eukprot:scaffold23499_cov31-Tisochrysis_lutea.AAC.2